MAKKELVNKVAGIGAGIVLGLSPLNSNAQDYCKIQEGVNAPTYEYKEDTPTHRVYHFNFNKDLQREIKSSKIPQLYITGDPNSYLIVDPDTSGWKLYYNKKNFNESGEGEKQIGFNIRGREHVNPCDPNALGSKTNYLVSFFWSPSHGFSEKPQEPTPTPKELPEQQSSTVYNVTNINNTTNTTTNFYGDTTSKKVEKPKGEGLEVRLLIDGNKTLNSNPIENPFWGASAAVQLGKGAVWVGPYATVGFGKETNASSTPVYHETLLNQLLNLSTVTKGERNELVSRAYPIEFGGLLSIGSKDGRVRVNLGYGVANEEVCTSDVFERGYDWISQNGAVVGEKKPYEIKLKEGTKSNNPIPTQKVGVDVHPFKKSGFYSGVEAQHRGKVNSKTGWNYNAKIGWRFGGKRK